MKKIIYTIVFFFFSLLVFLQYLAIPCMAETKIIKHGFYKLEDLNLSPNTEYKVQNISFNERVYIIILDEKETAIQSIRLWPQSQKYNLFPLEAGYKIIVTGDGELILS